MGSDGLSDSEAQEIMNNIVNHTLELLNERDLTEACSKAQEDAMSESIYRFPDEIKEETNEADVADSEFNENVSRRMPEESTGLLNFGELSTRIKNARQFNRTTTAARTPIKPSDVINMFGRQKNEQVNHNVGHETDRTEEFAKAEEKVVDTPRTTWADSKMSTKPGETMVNGQPYAYKFIRQKVDWGKSLGSKPEDVYDNLLLLKRKITSGVRLQFGDWSRITEIVVVGEQLIINKIMYVPMIEKQYIQYMPLDTQDYLYSGHLAPLFDWSVLKKMTNLRVLSIDDVGLFVTTVSDDLGLSRRAGVSSLFNICDSLDLVILGQDSVTRDTLNTEESEPIKRSIRRNRKFLNLFDGYKLDVYAGTSAFQDWTCGNLRNYATNRGDKGIFRYLGGVCTRGIVATAGLALNAGVHVMGGIAKTVKAVLHDASTPITKEEAFGSEN